MVHVNEETKPTKIELLFYRSASGREPVREWLLALQGEDRRAVGLDLMRVQYRWPVGMPLVRPLGKGLFEVRTPLPSDIIARVLFCFFESKLFALHGFIKKSQKTPDADLRIARTRKKEIEHGR